MWRIDRENYKKVLKGSSVLSTGGGGSFHAAMDEADEFFDGTSVSVSALEELSSDARVVMAYGLGSTAEDEDVDEQTALQNALNLYKQVQEQEVDAVLPAEMGPLALFDAFLVAERLDVPIVDTDAVGGRCVPTFTLFGTRFDGNSEAPVAVADTGETRIVLHAVESMEDLEAILRDIAVNLGTIIFGMGHARSVGDLSGYVKEGTLSTAREIGERIAERGWQSIEGVSGIDLVDTGTVENVEIEKTSGMYHATVTVEGNAENYEVSIKNEYMRLQDGEEIIAEAPDSILIVDTKGGYGPYSSDLGEDDDVAIFVRGAQGFWATNQGQKLFNQDAI
ncbi:MAG: DUF917 family protein [Halobacteria archaeon]